MRTLLQCLAEASELDLMAEASEDEAYRQRYVMLAESWRDVARLANWQDDFEKLQSSVK